MGRLSGSFSGAGITNDIIVAIYSTLAPAAEVARVVSPGPQGAYFNYAFTNLPDPTYIVRIHDSPDGVTLGNLRHDYWQDSLTNKITRIRQFFTVGGPGPYDPPAGSTVYSNPGNAGKEVVSIFQEGFRFLKPGVEVNFSDAANISLLGGLTYDLDQVWCVEFAESEEVGVTPSGGGGDFTTIELHSGNKTLAAADAGKTWMMTSGGNTQVTTLSLLSSFSDGDGFVIAHDGGPVINVEVKGAGSDVIRFRGADKSVIYLGKGEQIRIIKKGSKWYVTDYIGQWDRVGARVGLDAVPDNGVIANGTEYDGLIYKRLYDFVAGLPPSQQISFAVWNGSASKQKFFAIDTVNKRVKVPDMQGMSVRFLKNIGGADPSRTDNIPGGFQPWSVGPHDHSLPTDGAGASNVQSLMNSANSDEGLSALNTTGLNNPGGENRVDNVGLLPVILI